MFGGDCRALRLWRWKDLPPWKYEREREKKKKKVGVRHTNGVEWIRMDAYKPQLCGVSGECETTKQ